MENIRNAFVQKNDQLSFIANHFHILSSMIYEISMSK